MRTLEELQAILDRYKPHDHSYDEREGGDCPVCEDIDQIEHEISLIQSNVVEPRDSTV